MLLNKNEFCELTGVAPKDLPIYYKRGKFCYVAEDKGKDARIDTDLPINAAFVNQRKQLLAKENGEQAPAQKVKSKPAPAQPEIKIPSPANTSFIPSLPFSAPKPAMPQQAQAKQQQTVVNVSAENKNENNVKLFKATEKIKEKELEKKTIETELLIFKKEKISGSVIPARAIEPLLFIYNMNYMNGANSIFKELIGEIAHVHDMSGEEIAMYKRNVIDKLNSLSDSVRLDAKSKLSTIINEYSAKKEAGEKM